MLTALIARMKTEIAEEKKRLKAGETPQDAAVNKKIDMKNTSIAAPWRRWSK